MLSQHKQRWLQRRYITSFVCCYSVQLKAATLCYGSFSLLLILLDAKSEGMMQCSVHFCRDKYDWTIDTANTGDNCHCWEQHLLMMACTNINHTEDDNICEQHWWKDSWTSRKTQWCSVTRSKSLPSNFQDFLLIVSLGSCIEIFASNEQWLMADHFKPNNRALTWIW